MNFGNDKKLMIIPPLSSVYTGGRFFVVLRPFISTAILINTVTLCSYSPAADKRKGLQASEQVELNTGG